MVPRYQEIQVKAFDRNAKEIEFIAKGIFAVVIQHETDHLDGILFPDRMEDLSTLTFMNEYVKYWVPKEQ